MNQIFEYVTNLKNPKLMCIGQNYPSECNNQQQLNNTIMWEEKIYRWKQQCEVVMEPILNTNQNVEEFKVGEEELKMNQNNQTNEDQKNDENKQEDKMIEEKNEVIVIQEEDERQKELLCVYYKPVSSLIQNFDDEIYIKLPESGHLLDYGIELGFMLDRVGKNISKKESREFIAGYFIAFTFQDRKLKNMCEKKQLPLTIANGQDGFTPVSQIVEERLIRDPYLVKITVKLNEKIIWQGSPNNMIHKIDKIINYLSYYQTLYPGDFILTGSLKQFGPIKKKERLFAQLESDGEILATLDVIFK